MALFGDENEQSTDDTTETESDGWNVDDSGRSSHPDPAIDDDQGAGTDLDTATIAHGDPNGTLKRAVDEEAGVVVYAYKNGNAGGLSTVPLSDTDLDGDE